ncbi:MAG: hypothetical protein AB7S98_05180 [Burkholderiaceae bacterium]
MTAFLLVVLAWPAGAESPVTGFRDLKWGDPIERLGELGPARPTELADVRCHARKDDSMSFGEATLAAIHYCFYRNRFYSFELQAQPGRAHYEALKRELVKRYGPPGDDGPLSARWGENGQDVQLTLLSGTGDVGALLDAYYSPIGLELLKAGKPAAVATPTPATAPGSSQAPGSSSAPAAPPASAAPGTSTSKAAPAAPGGSPGAGSATAGERR